MTSWALIAVGSRIVYLSDVRPHWHVQLLGLRFGSALHVVYLRLVIG